jgi:hypothetical protein
MKFVDGCIEMEQCEWPGSIGDSMAETYRHDVLDWFSDNNVRMPTEFVTDKGFLRHPSLAGKAEWDEADMSNDNLLPMLLCCDFVDPGFPFIRGTRTLLSLGCILIKLKMFRALNVINIVQGWLLPGPDKDESADYLNFAIIYIWLKRTGRWATLSVSPDLVMAKVRSYYKPEPNSDWIVELYRRNLIG